MSTPERVSTKRPRGTYSRLICLGCRERRIRCELPAEVKIPSPGELRKVQTPCYRCKRLGISCVVRQTVLGRPAPETASNSAADRRSVRDGDIVSQIIIELPSRTGACAQSVTLQSEAQMSDSCSSLQSNLRSSDNLPPGQGSWKRDGAALLIHKPQSTQTVIIIRALETLRCQSVEDEWFRHLPAHFGHTPALDLSIEAIVVACAYARGVPKLTSNDCYQALALAINAVQVSIKQSCGDPNDDILASTALLAPFEGVIKRNGVPTRLHVEGLAAMLAARPATYPVTELARDILDFIACESSIMACIQGTFSPFESVAQAYFSNDRIGYSDSDRAQLKALGNELFIRIPRLVSLVRLLRFRRSPQDQLLLNTLELSKSLLGLQDSQAEGRLLQNIRNNPLSNFDATAALRQSLYFASVKDFEALAYYWQSRLSLLRLEWRLHNLCLSNNVQTGIIDDQGIYFQSNLSPMVNEMLRLAKNILMCSEYAGRLRLHKHARMFAHAMVVVWGVTMEVPIALSHYQDEEGPAALPNYLLRWVNLALGAKPALIAEDMDIAADIFVGGLSKGRFAELYGL